MVGDFVYDVEAGRNAGSRTVLLLRDYPVSFENDADFTVDSLMEVADIIRRSNAD
jgi:phosphoglycolate phosphatase-like HAD superfamily hydrolase